GIVIPTVFRLRGWVSVLITAFFSFVALSLGTVNWLIGFNTGNFPLDYDAIAAFFTGTPVENLMFNETGVVIYTNNLTEVWTFLLPMVLLFALGMHFQLILADIRSLFQRSPVSMSSITDVRLPEMAPIAGPATVRLDTAQEQAGTMQLPELDVSVEPMTEEFELGQVGGKHHVMADTKKLASDPNLMTMRKDEMSALTEEFEVGQVGGRADEANSTDGEDRPDWDAIMSPLGLHTEEFEVGQVGGRADETPEDDDNPNEDRQ
ncbi:MAG: hypothetical protein AAF653_15170, partial [Chloroflexota bacterium]